MKRSNVAGKHIIGSIVLLLVCLHSSSAQNAQDKITCLLPSNIGYEDVNWDMERGFLDNAAQQLKVSPDSYLLATFYAGRHSCQGFARKRGLRAANYLAKTWKLTSRQFIWHDGGYDEEPKTDILLLPNIVDPSDMKATTAYRPPKPEWKISKCK